MKNRVSGLVNVENGINDNSVKDEVVREFTSLDEIGFMGTTNI